VYYVFWYFFSLYRSAYPTYEHVYFILNLTLSNTIRNGQAQFITGVLSCSVR